MKSLSLIVATLLATACHTSPIPASEDDPQNLALATTDITSSDVEFSEWPWHRLPDSDVGPPKLPCDKLPDYPFDDPPFPDNPFNPPTPDPPCKSYVSHVWDEWQPSMASTRHTWAFWCDNCSPDIDMQAGGLLWGDHLEGYYSCAALNRNRKVHWSDKWNKWVIEQNEVPGPVGQQVVECLVNRFARHWQPYACGGEGRSEIQWDKLGHVW